MDTQLTHQPEMEAILTVENLIFHLLSSSEEKKSKGQSMFDLMKEQYPNSIALHLAQLVGASDSHDVVFRQECANLLTKLLTDNKCHFWKNNLSVSTQSNIKSILLTHINLEEYSGYIMVIVCQIVSKLCNISNNWPELLHFLQECINSNRLKDSFFYIFADLAQDILKMLFPDMMTLQSLFLKTLNDDTLNFYTRGVALAATINFILCMSSLNELKQVQSLYPAMMRTLVEGLSVGDGNVAAQYRLKYYVKLAKNEPRFFRIHIVDMVNTMFEIAENMNLEEGTRCLAIEVLLTLVEAREKAPGMMKKIPLFTNNYFALLLNLLLDVKDDPSWNSADNSFDTSGIAHSCRIYFKFLGRFSNALGGKTVSFIAIEQLDAYLDDQMWEKRHAALIALTFISRGCSKVLIKHLERVVSMFLHSCQDHHPRVRWAAIGLMVELSINFSPDLYDQHHNQVVPTLVTAMDDFQHPRVQAIAVRAIQIYFDVCKNPNALLPYLDAILNKLLVLLQNDNQIVQEASLGALTSIPDLSKEHFQEYYGFVMSHLRTLLVNANNKSNHMLHSKALECISKIGIIVGKEMFRDDVKQVIEVLVSSQESSTKEFGTINHILQAWARICTCLGKDFLPYMSTVMPFLVKCAQLQLINIIDELNDSVQKVKFGDDMIYAKRSDLLDVKSLACGMFGGYAIFLEEDFYPWISQAISILAPLLKFYIHNDVRKECSGAMPSLLKSAKLVAEKGTGQGESYLFFNQLSRDIIFALGNAVYTESETEVCTSMLCSLADCLKTCGLLLSEDLLPRIVDVIKHVITESSCRRGALKEREKLEGFDVEEAELLMEKIEEEEEVYEKVALILVILIQTFKAAFLPFVDELPLDIITSMNGKDKTTREKMLYITLFGTCLEECSEAALVVDRYHDVFFPFVLEACNDENTQVRQYALYDLMLCAEYRASIFKPFVEEALVRINIVISHLHAREPLNVNASDMAAFVLGNICLIHWESIDSIQIVIPVWLSCLPVKDLFLTKEVHTQLCLMARRYVEVLLGPRYEYFPKVLSVITEVLCAGNDFATEETTNIMIFLLRIIHEATPSVIWAFAVSLLLPQQELELQYVLSHEEEANILLTE